jgi:hypothetical protein
MKALISPDEQVYDINQNYIGQRIAQVEPNDKIFDVAPPLYWMDCNDYVNPNDYCYNNNTMLIVKINTQQELIDATEIVY